jgi:hypothetical protein
MGVADTGPEELIALCANFIVAKGACDSAPKLRPEANLVLSHRARIISRAGITGMAASASIAR